MGLFAEGVAGMFEFRRVKVPPGLLDPIWERDALEMKSTVARHSWQISLMRFCLASFPESLMSLQLFEKQYARLNYSFIDNIVSKNFIYYAYIIMMQIVL
ncbi:hypothetical protein CDAR_66941 [Caerostris darwini]|uniref:Uncharacterized protein n=1 Tax=Caerostris darwini TaxID=1538125 RepID=A0AAV4QVM7_9ARAC|nr:hypothetical protein CDAR_66941 [Caerostris darwini]